MGARQVAEDTVHLLFGQDSGQAFGLFGAQGVYRSQVLTEHFTVEEQKGAEGLTSTSSVQGFCVEAATFSFTARWVRKVSILRQAQDTASGAPISLGWRLPWNRI